LFDYVLKIEGLNESRNIDVVTGKGLIDSPDVRDIFGAGQLQPDLEHEFVGLCVELDSEEGHAA
jgi:hypothetical protein